MYLLINLASLLIVYDYCVPVQMVMQMAMGAVQVCVSVQTLSLNLAICKTYPVTLFDFLALFTSLIISIRPHVCHLPPAPLYMLKVYHCGCFWMKEACILGPFP